MTALVVSAEAILAAIREAGDEQPRRSLQPCGTHAAYNRHRVAGEQPCEACRTGERAYQAEAHRRRNPQRSQRFHGRIGATAEHGEAPTGVVSDGASWQPTRQHERTTR